jgi:macrolide transport system ATP-binding/permease protein
MGSSLTQDLGYALRQLLKSPAFTTSSLLTLALGMSTNVIAFGVLHVLILRSLDVKQPAGLYNIVHARCRAEGLRDSAIFTTWSS